MHSRSDRQGRRHRGGSAGNFRPIRPFGADGTGHPSDRPGITAMLGPAYGTTPRSLLMADPGRQHHLEIKEGEQIVAAADVTIPPGDDPGPSTAQASLHVAPGHVPPGCRASLVDAVMDLPGVQQ